MPVIEALEPHVSAIVTGLGGRAARVRNGCAELASLLSEAHPQLLYPHLALFQANLAAKESVLRPGGRLHHRQPRRRRR